MPPPPRSRGAGSSRQKPGTQSPDENAGNTRYERISLLAQELMGCATGGDGAESTVFSGEEDEEDEFGESKEELKEHVFEEAEEDSDEEGAVSALQASSNEDDDEEEGGRFRARKKSKQTEKRSKNNERSKSNMFTATAFGAAYKHPTGGMVSEDESVASQTSSKRKFNAHKKAFPVRGSSCVGCNLANRIEPVELFVKRNVGRMTPEALWKLSSLTWQKEVVEPAKREGVHVVPWRWRDIAKHFRMHTTMAVVGRTAMVNTLTAMRCQIEGSLVRNENGVRSLDKANAELALKIVAAESRERQLLLGDCASARARGSSGSQKPAGGEE